MAAGREEEGRGGLPTTPDPAAELRGVIADGSTGPRGAGAGADGVGFGGLFDRLGRRKGKGRFHANLLPMLDSLHPLAA